MVDHHGRVRPRDRRGVRCARAGQGPERGRRGHRAEPQRHRRHPVRAAAGPGADRVARDLRAARRAHPVLRQAVPGLDVLRRRGVATLAAPRSGCLLEARVPRLQAVRADAVREPSVGVLRDVGLELVPVALVVTQFLAVGADRQEPGQLLHLAERVRQFDVARLKLGRPAVDQRFQRGLAAPQ